MEEVEIAIGLAWVAAKEKWNDWSNDAGCINTCFI